MRIFNSPRRTRCLLISRIVMVVSVMLASFQLMAQAQGKERSVQHPTFYLQIGTGITRATPGAIQGHYLIVSDIKATRAELVARGVDVSEPIHFGPEGQTPGLDPARADYNSFVSFSDPDGNGWLIQEVKQRAAGR
jgi:hypothetical protein